MIREVTCSRRLDGGLHLTATIFTYNIGRLFCPTRGCALAGRRDARVDLPIWVDIRPQCGRPTPNALSHGDATGFDVRAIAGSHFMIGRYMIYWRLKNDVNAWPVLSVNVRM
jgi:hypothetical protein